MNEQRRVLSASPYEARFGFCRAVRTGDVVRVAGTAPIGPDGATAPGDAAAQARRCFEIVRDALAELGGAPSDVVRTRMYLVRVVDGDAVGAVHGEFFGAAAPAATIVVVQALLDPAWLVEVEAEAVVSRS